MLFVMELKTMRRVFLHRHNNAIFIEIIKEKSKKVLTTVMVHGIMYGQLIDGPVAQLVRAHP